MHCAILLTFPPDTKCHKYNLKFTPGSENFKLGMTTANGGFILSVLDSDKDHQRNKNLHLNFVSFGALLKNYILFILLRSISIINFTTN